MELILMLVAPFPLGLLLRSRLAAYLAYTAAHAFAFTVQTLTLTMQWIQGASTAFGRHPEGSPWSYSLVNLLIYLLGLALVALGARTAARRRAKATTVDLQPV